MFFDCQEREEVLDVFLRDARAILVPDEVHELADP
jgi:hypothetical protein